MAASVQASLRAAFVAKLGTALAGLGGGSAFVADGLAYAWTSGLERHRDRIWTHGGSFQMEPASLRAGATVFDETGSFWVYVECLKVGGSVEDALARCFELAGVVFTEAARHRTDLGVTGLQWITTGGVDDQSEGRVEKGSGARVRCVINYKARTETP